MNQVKLFINQLTMPVRSSALRCLSFHISSASVNSVVVFVVRLQQLPTLECFAMTSSFRLFLFLICFDMLFLESRIYWKQ